MISFVRGHGGTDGSKGGLEVIDGGEDQTDVGIGSADEAVEERGVVDMDDHAISKERGDGATLAKGELAGLVSQISEGGGQRSLLRDGRVVSSLLGNHGSISIKDNDGSKARDLVNRRSQQRVDRKLTKDRRRNEEERKM